MIVEVKSVVYNRDRVRQIHLYNGGEYFRKNLKGLLMKSSNFPEYSPLYSPECNGRAERLNCTLLDKPRVMVNPLGEMHKDLYEEDIATEKYIINGLYIYGWLRDEMAPIEAPTGTKPDVLNLQIFDYMVFVHIRGKLRAG